MRCKFCGFEIDIEIYIFNLPCPICFYVINPISNWGGVYLLK